MKAILEKYVDQPIGINILGTNHVDEVMLKSVSESYFSVLHEQDGNSYHIPYIHVLHVAENESGVKEGKFLYRIKTSLPVFVRLGPAFDYLVG